VIRRREVTYLEEDNSPDYLLPSNGGYNPKQKSIFVEDVHVNVQKQSEQFADNNEKQQPEDMRAKVSKKTRSTTDYAKMLRDNIN
jgi:hypothetical protein